MHNSVIAKSVGMKYIVDLKLVKHVGQTMNETFVNW